MIISVTSSNKTNKSEKPAKRTTPSIYKKKKVRVKGFVDRISNGIVVVVIRNPVDNESVKEISEKEAPVIIPQMLELEPE